MATKTNSNDKRPTRPSTTGNPVYDNCFNTLMNAGRPVEECRRYASQAAANAAKATAGYTYVGSTNNSAKYDYSIEEGREQIAKKGNSIKSNIDDVGDSIKIIKHDGTNDSETSDILDVAYEFMSKSKIYGSGRISKYSDGLIFNSDTVNDRIKELTDADSEVEDKRKRLQEERDRGTELLKTAEENMRIAEEQYNKDKGNKQWETAYMEAQEAYYKLQDRVGDLNISIKEMMYCEGELGFTINYLKDINNIIERTDTSSIAMVSNLKVDNFCILSAK